MATTPDFSTVGGELAYWFSHITQRFKGGYSGSGENGVDIGMPTGTPVYAVAGGPVVGNGYYAGGGVVSIKQQQGRVWYYQHLDLIEPSIASGQTKQVQPGQLIGWSGGQLSGGQHPSSRQFSSGPHIEVGVNAPWQGIWGPASDKSANVDPLPILHGTDGSAPTGMPLAYTGGDVLNPSDWIAAIGAWLKSTFGTLFTWGSDPLRILKLLGGLLLVGIASQIVIAGLVLQAAGPFIEAAGAVEGNPAAASRSATVRQAGAVGTVVRERRRPALPPPHAQQPSGGTSGPPAVLPSGPPGSMGGPSIGFMPVPAWRPKNRAAERARQKQEEKEQAGVPVYLGKQRIGVQMPDGTIKLDKGGSVREPTAAPQPFRAPASFTPSPPSAPESSAETLTPEQVEQLRQKRTMGWSGVDSVLQDLRGQSAPTEAQAAQEAQVKFAESGRPMEQLDYQCIVCDEIFAGPDAGANPGKQVGSYNGHPVSNVATHGIHEQGALFKTRGESRRRKGFKQLREGA